MINEANVHPRLATSPTNKPRRSRYAPRYCVAVDGYYYMRRWWFIRGRGGGSNSVIVNYKKWFILTPGIIDYLGTIQSVRVRYARSQEAQGNLGIIRRLKGNHLTNHLYNKSLAIHNQFFNPWHFLWPIYCPHGYRITKPIIAYLL